MGFQFLQQQDSLFRSYGAGSQIWSYHSSKWGLYQPYDGDWPDVNDRNQFLYDFFQNSCQSQTSFADELEDLPLIFKAKNGIISIEHLPRGESQIEVYSLLGKRVYEEKSSDNAEIELGFDFQPGVYLIRVLHGNRNRSAKIFIY